jgi:hypothetical protein
MSNVKKGGSSSVPEELRLKGVTGDVKKPPSTIDAELRGAAGKHGMNFKHKPLGPEMDYVDSESNKASEHEDRADKQGGKEGVGGKKPRHRSVSGTPGHTLAGS